jgi:hypothetical protein
MIMGFGCNVPAILATRSMRNRGDRILTMLIIPFMSCGAKFPVYVLIAGTFFPREMAGNIIMGYLLILDTNREPSYWKSLEIFLKMARAENVGKAEYIRISTLNDLGKFKYE